jgi:hypothetical protein
MSYARAGIPLYLLIDRFAGSGPTVELHSRPREAEYRATTRVPFGESIGVPAPFDFTLETEDF